MKGAQLLRLASLIVLVTASAYWVLAGAHRGWTRTSVERKTLDDVTGIESITYEKRFVPGVDFLAAALAGAAFIGAASFLFPKTPIKPDQTKLNQNHPQT